jgi:hypothetical protein
MSEEKIAAEVVEAEFERWSDAMGLKRKLDPTGMDTEDKKSLADQKKTLIDVMMSGSLVVDDAGQFRYTPQIGDDLSPITFYEPDGVVLMAVDAIGKSGAQEVAKMMALLAAMTKQSRPRFAKMKNRDLSVCQAILSLFLAR